MKIKCCATSRSPGRVCYKSEGNITEDSYFQFINNIIKRGHESVLEHEKVTVKFVVDRGISHEKVRHRIASYSQSSTRYCNFSKGEFSGEITFINPFFLEGNPKAYSTWYGACQKAEKAYFDLLNIGMLPQEARSVLPNSLKTEVVMTANLREWRHFFRLRADKAAHPQMRQVAIPLLLSFRANLRPVFNDIPYDHTFPSEHYAKIEWREERG